MNISSEEFDSYAADYDAALKRGIGLSGESKTYFARQRLTWLKARLDGISFAPRSILDFGCGTGSAVPFVRQTFGAARIVGVDVSSASLELARQTYGGEAEFSLLSEWPEGHGDFDLVFCNGVFHHIRPEHRPSAVSFIAQVLVPDGMFALWENNPWSPAARLVMSRIPFDRDAVMVWPRDARRLSKDAGLEALRTDFLFVFPRSLKGLRRFEPALSALPLGAQYQVLARKRR